MRVSSSGWAPIQRMRVRSGVGRVGRRRGLAYKVPQHNTTGSIIRLMRGSRFIIVFYGFLVLTVACQRERTTDQTASVDGSGTAMPTNPPKPRVQDLSNAKVNQVLPLAAAPLEKSLVGGNVKDGVVASEQMQFLPGKPVYLTMWLKESPAGLQTSVRWFDAKHKEVLFDSKPMNGSKVATFVMNQKLKPGKYHVTGYWGGNEACDYDFEVVKAGKK
jgi:hypothetical protein